MSWLDGKRAIITVKHDGCTILLDAVKWEYLKDCGLLQVMEEDGSIHSFTSMKMRSFKITPKKDDKNGN